MFALFLLNLAVYFCMLGVNLIVFPLNLRANLSALLFYAVKRKFISRDFTDFGLKFSS
nr:hypothetical protein [uncultured Campylobacter sp.]